MLYYIDGSNNKNILNCMKVTIVTNTISYVTCMIYSNNILPTWVRLEITINEGLMGPRTLFSIHSLFLLFSVFLIPLHTACCQLLQSAATDSQDSMLISTDSIFCLQAFLYCSIYVTPRNKNGPNTPGHIMYIKMIKKTSCGNIRHNDNSYAGHKLAVCTRNQYFMKLFIRILS